jgi:hypothetical protein
MGAMLSEEALIVLAAIGACGLLLVGVLELVWPTRPRHPIHRRTPAAPRAARPHRQSALTRHTRDRSRAYSRRHVPLPPPVVPPAPFSRAVVSPRWAQPSPEITEPLPHVIAAPVPVETVTIALELQPPRVEQARALVDLVHARAEESIVETCFALYQEHRYVDVIERASDALSGGPDGTPPGEAQEIAALWSVVALAQQGLAEDAAARDALEAAIAAAPSADRPTYQRQLATLAEHAAQGLLAEAERHTTPDSEDCLTMVRNAVAWLERGVAVAPSDSKLAELTAGAQARLWPAWERTVMALVQRQDFRAARRLLRDALADPGFPVARTETFRELFSGTFSGEIGQLTAQAIRSMQEARESDALASLQRAETLLDTLNAEALPPSRREEVDRRLWWGYNKLGTRRVEAGEHEPALEPLFHALGYEVGPARRQETVALLVRALDGVADVHALAIRELADTGDREGAIVACDKLWALLRSATEMGLAQDDLGGTFTKVQRLFDSLDCRRT